MESKHETNNISSLVCNHGSIALPLLTQVGKFTSGISLHVYLNKQISTCMIYVVIIVIFVISSVVSAVAGQGMISLGSNLI